jgi:hypothetical protein
LHLIIYPFILLSLLSMYLSSFSYINLSIYTYIHTYIHRSNHQCEKSGFFSSGWRGIVCKGYCRRESFFPRCR